MAIGQESQSSSGTFSGLAITNTTDSTIAIPGNSFINPGTATITGGPFTEATQPASYPNFEGVPLYMNSRKKLIGIATKLEEFFEYKYYINPVIQPYSTEVNFIAEISHAGNMSADTMPPSGQWTEPLLNNVKGDSEDQLKKSEILHATASMIWGILYFRSINVDGLYGQERKQPKEWARKFIYKCAFGFAFEEHEVPEEALGKFALIEIET